MERGGEDSEVKSGRVVTRSGEPVSDAEQPVEAAATPRRGDEAAADESVDAVAACSTGLARTRGPSYPSALLPFLCLWRRTFPVGEFASLQRVVVGGARLVDGPACRARVSR